MYTATGATTAITWTNVDFFIIKLLWYSPDSDFISFTQTTILYNEFRNYNFRIITSIPMTQQPSHKLCSFALSHGQYAGSTGFD